MKKIAIAQFKFIHEVDHNREKILYALNLAQEQGAELVVFPELALSGPTPQILLTRPEFQAQLEAALPEIQAHTQHLTAVIGYPEQSEQHLYNSAVVFQEGIRVGTYRKCHLSSQGVRQEHHYFTPGQQPFTFSAKGIRIGITLGEELTLSSYPPPVDLLLALQTFPFERDRFQDSQKLPALFSLQDSGILCVNQTGGQDTLIFPGGSFYSQAGHIIVQAPYFEEGLLVIEGLKAPRPLHTWIPLPAGMRYGESRIFSLKSREKVAIHTLESGRSKLLVEATPLRRFSSSSLSDMAGMLYRAIMLGIRDYVHQNGFDKVVIGISGGVDSALVAALAVDALGSSAVKGIFLPSTHTSELSRRCQEELVQTLGIECQTIPITAVHEQFQQLLIQARGSLQEVTDENLQARCRAVILMGLVNEMHAVLLATSNKSEIFAGYGTLYGDLIGGIAPIQDLTKTWVYRLVNWRNQQGLAIPESIIQRAPTAELKPNQTDQDTLPPYELLDQILEDYMEQGMSVRELEQSYPPEVIYDLVKRMRRAEFKRRQAPPGFHLTSQGFGENYRFPIAS